MVAVMLIGTLASPGLTNKVLIIGIDGTMCSALAVAKTPNLDALKSNGCFTVRAVTHPVTHSAACWSSMFTGVWGDKHLVKEAFSNARKHAQTDCVFLSFMLADSQVCIRIQDNGRGFDPTRAAGEGHFGLRFMRERAEMLGGRLQVKSTPGQGTCVEVEVPLMRAYSA